MVVVEVVQMKDHLSLVEQVVVDQEQEEIVVLQEHLEQPTLVVAVVVEMTVYKVVEVDQVS
jgi:hypothetical protein|tara:strand:+ start:410 stop:592 length:183 start_codon:yes stop_codon:yes gene_type:complete